VTRLRRQSGTPETDEGGYTLVELLVSVTLAALLGVMGLTVATTFFNAEKVVTASYGNLNQLTPIGTSFQQFIRSAVSPAPTPTTPLSPGTPGQPVPPFGIYSKSTGALTPAVKFTTSSLTFFTNINNKIAKVVATLSRTTEIFSVTTTLATSTCPTSTSTFTHTCKFTGPVKTAFRVEYVTNGTTADKPIFTYYVTGTATPVPFSDFADCTSTTCDAGDIQSVGVDLVVNESPKVGHSADQETVTYDVSSSSQAFNPAVG
jgi:type II secretory pathway pseudopilin PulG